jgi:hypothetical protein
MVEMGPGLRQAQCERYSLMRFQMSLCPEKQRPRPSRGRLKLGRGYLPLPRCLRRTGGCRRSDDVKQVKQNDDRDRNPEQPKQNASTHTNILPDD